MESTLFMYLDKKKTIKHLSKKSFSVFNGLPPNTIEHTKTVFGQMFYYFVIKVHEKCIFYHFNIIFKTFMLVLTIKGIVYSKTFKYLRYKKGFLDKKSKNMVFRYKKKNYKKAPKYKITSSN